MNIWEGVYKSFKDVPQKGNPFNSERWVSSVVKKTNWVRSQIDRPSNQSVLPLIVSLIPKEEISIFDFGGGMGVDLINCLNSTYKKIEYEILENKKITELGKNSAKNINFINSLTELSSNNFDIFHCHSSIQYFENPSSFISSVIVKINPSFISFEDLPVVNVDTFATGQNYYNSVIPCWFFNKTEFIKILSLYNYSLIYNSAYIQNTERALDRSMANFKKDYRSNEFQNLIFKLT